MVNDISIPVPPENGWNAFAKDLYDIDGQDVFTR